MPTSLYRYQFDLYVDIASTRYSCNSFSATFPLNGLPTCDLSLSVGQQVKAEASNVSLSRPRESFATLGSQSLIAEDVFLDRAQVFLETRGASRAQAQWPGLPADKTFMIFDGFLNGPTFDNSRLGVQDGVSLTHWLLALSFVSGLDKRTYAASPFAADIPALSSNGASAKASFIQQLSGDLQVAIESARNDLWGEGIVPFIRAFADSKIEGVTLGDCFAGLSTDAADASLRIVADYLEASIKSPDYKPLALRQGTAVDQLSGKFGEFLSNNLGFGGENQTLWDKLVASILPKIHAHFVIGVDRAYAAPVVFGYEPSNQDQLKTIYVDEVTRVTASSHTLRPIRGIQLFSADSYSSGLPTSEDGQQIPAFSGCYLSPTGQGAVLYRAASDFYAGLYEPPSASSILGLNKRTVATKTNNNDGAAPKAAKPAKQQADDARTLLSSVAQLMFYDEALRGRVARVICPLRLDIAPGSTVRVKVPQGRRDGTPDLDLVGVVTKVTIGIDAGRSAGLTTLEIRNYRLLNTRDLPPITRHPLYGEDAYNHTALTALD